MLQFWPAACSKAKEDPGCVQALMQPVPTDRKGEIPTGKGPTYLMPIVHVHKGLLTVNYGEQATCSCSGS